MSDTGASRQEGPATRHVRFKEILVVEDDETWALALQDALAHGGYRVNPTMSLYDAVRAVRKSPDLVLVSALVGDQVSETLLREIESLRLPPPVLLVGTRKGEARWESWKSLSCLSTVGQPFQLVDVLEAARAILGSPWEDLTGEADQQAQA